MIESGRMKVLVIGVKYLPATIAYLHFINMVLSLCDFYIPGLTFFTNCGFLTLLLLYLLGKTLKMCNYYNAYLLYLTFNNIICWIDYELEFGIDLRMSWILVLGSFFVLMSYMTVRHFRQKGLKILKS